MLRYKIKWISIFLLITLAWSVLCAVVGSALHIPEELIGFISIIFGYILGTVCILKYMHEV